MPSVRLLAPALLPALLALGACGGGTPAPPRAGALAWPEHLAPAGPAPAEIVGRKRTLSATDGGGGSAGATIAPDQLFNWAQRMFPQYFPHHAATQRQGAWTYRAYFETGVMLGLKDGEVHVVGGPFGPNPVPVGQAGDYLAPAIPVLPTSIQNKQAFNEPARVLPIPPRASWDIQTWHARAWADFEQTGTFSLFVHTVRNVDSYLTPKADLYARGELFFYRYEPSDGSYTDITSQLVENPQPGCNTPNMAMVADLNADGRPDILVACTGPDVPMPEDAHRDTNVLLLSQPDGRYRQSTVDLGSKAYPHGTSLGDVDGDGWPDLVVADIAENRVGRSPVYAMINNRDGTFTKRSIGFDHLKGQEVWTVHLVDLNGDGRLALWIGSAYQYVETRIRPAAFHRLRNGAFEQAPFATFDMPPAFALDYDIVADGGRAYVLSQMFTYEGSAITRLDFATRSATLIWSNTTDYGSLYATRPECRGIAGKTLDLIRTHAGRIVTDDACRSPSVPL